MIETMKRQIVGYQRGFIDAKRIYERKKGKWMDYIGSDLGIEGQWLRDDGKTVFCNATSVAVCLYEIL